MTEGKRKTRVNARERERTDMAADVAAISNAQRLRILNALDDIRDGCYSTAAAALAASRSFHLGREDDAEKLARVISQCEQISRLAQTIARELNK